MSVPKVMFYAEREGVRGLQSGRLYGIDPYGEMFWVWDSGKVYRTIPKADICRANYEAFSHPDFGPILKALGIEAFVDGYGADVKAAALAAENIPPYGNQRGKP